MTAITAYSPTGDAYVDGLLGDVKWTGNNFTYSFPAAASFYGASYGSGEPLLGFEALNSNQQAAVRAALKLYGGVANLTFSEIAETAIQHADLRLAMSNKPSTAWAYFPSMNPSGGDAWFNNASQEYDAPAKGNYAYLTFIHELGHVFGLEHAHEYMPMPLDRDSLEYTVMSYRSFVGASTETGYVNENWGFSQSLMMYDIAALQYLYGANYATNSGNTTYSWNSSTGEMSVDGVGQGAAGANRILLTVWDGGGIDTYDFSSYAAGVTVDLSPGRWTTISKAQLAALSWDGSKMAEGNVANALLHDNDSRSLIENATGGAGNDSFTGNQAANVLKGGAGADSLAGGAGNDVLDGGTGADTVAFGGDLSQYGVLHQADGSVRVADQRAGAPDGTDIVWNIESFEFGGNHYSQDALFAAATTSFAPISASLKGTSGNNSLYGTAGNDTLYGSGGNDVLNGGAGRDRIDGGSGLDTASYTGAKAMVLADLLLRSVNRGDAAGDVYVHIENLIGSGYGDSLRGNQAANVLKGLNGNDLLYGRGGNDVLDGGSGNDTLYGQAGRDVLIGRSGRDIFVFNSVNESHGSATDTVKDFISRVDKIDLRRIDADNHWSGNQAFTFIGKAGFKGKAGELSFSHGILSGDINGDAAADFQVKLLHVAALTKGDFYL